MKKIIILLILLFACNANLEKNLNSNIDTGAIDELDNTSANTTTGSNNASTNPINTDTTTGSNNASTNPINTDITTGSNNASTNPINTDITTGSNNASTNPINKLDNEINIDYTVIAGDLNEANIKFSEYLNSERNESLKINVDIPYYEDIEDDYYKIYVMFIGKNENDIYTALGSTVFLSDKYYNEDAKEAEKYEKINYENQELILSNYFSYLVGSYTDLIVSVKYAPYFKDGNNIVSVSCDNVSDYNEADKFVKGITYRDYLNLDGCNDKIKRNNFLDLYHSGETTEEESRSYYNEYLNNSIDYFTLDTNKKYLKYYFEIHIDDDFSIEEDDESYFDNLEGQKLYIYNIDDQIEHFNYDYAYYLDKNLIYFPYNNLISLNEDIDELELIEYNGLENLYFNEEKINGDYEMKLITEYTIPLKGSFTYNNSIDEYLYTIAEN